MQGGPDVQRKRKTKARSGWAGLCGLASGNRSFRFRMEEGIELALAKQHSWDRKGIYKTSRPVSGSWEWGFTGAKRGVRRVGEEPLKPRRGGRMGRSHNWVLRGIC